MRLQRDFFQRDTLTVARDLLGTVLVRELNGTHLSGRIVEVEAYTGWDDLASHGYRGPTERNAVMFGRSGFSYVYLIYGMYWLLNVVAKPAAADYPAAVLIRALEPLAGLDMMAERRAGQPVQGWTSGPGKLTIALDIGPELGNLDMTAPDSPLYILPGNPVPDAAVARGPRIGISVPEPWQSQPWRFWEADNPHVSR